MAKLQNLGAIVNVNDVYWRTVKNYGRHEALVDNETKRCEHAVMMKDGWLPIYSIEVYELDDKGLKEVEANIMAEWAALEGVHPESKYPTTPEVKLNDAQRREGFKAMWFPNGKLQLPKYDAIFGFQRGKSLTDAVALNIALGDSEKEAVAKLHLPIQIVKYTNEADRILRCGMENTSKDTGRTSIMKHWPSLLKLAKGYFDASGGTATMSEINVLLAGGVVKNNNDGIKVHSLLMLDTRFPELGIYSKICEAGVDDKNNDLGQIFAGPLDRTKVWKMVQWFDAKKAETDAAKGEKTTGPGTTTQEEVAEYLEDPLAERAPKVTPASKAQINLRMNSTPNMFEKYIWYVASCGKMEMLTKLTPPAISIEQLREINNLAEKLGLCKGGELLK